MSTDADHPLGELGLLAEQLGVQTSYWDTRGRAHAATPDALVSVLGSLGAPIDHPERLDDLRAFIDHLDARPVEPVAVHWQDEAPTIDVRVRRDRAHPAVSFHLELEDGSVHDGRLDLAEGDVVAHRWPGGVEHVTVRTPLPVGPLPIGYHALVVDVDGHEHAATWIEAPERVVQPAPAERTWGLLAALHSLRSEGALGPNVGLLAEVGRWIDAHGGRVVATLPILATYLDEPHDPSPYTPVSQRFWNELYCDVEAVPELAASPAARALLDDPATRRAAAELAAGELFDHRAQYRLVRPVLEALAATFFGAPASTRAEFERWALARGDVVPYGAFRSATDLTGTGWHAWGRGAGQFPEGFDPSTGAGADGARLHLYAQWAMHRQLTGLAADLAEREQRLYLDLPVGTHGDGFDTWAHHDLFAWGCGVGAPPDDFFSEGQNWGFPPISPLAARASGHRHLAACVRHHLSAAGILRLDHVMGFHRLYWVPDGAGAKEGVYVHQPRDEQFAVLAVESARAGARVVGEDLGTVPDEVRHALDRHGLLGMYVSQFQLPDHDGARLPLPTARQVASLDTHDTPTFAGWLQGLDIGVRQGMGLLDDEEVAAAHAERQRDVDRVVAALQADGLLGDAVDPTATLTALLRALGGSPAPALLLGADDLVGETDPQNVPGTGLDRPNWVRRLPRPVAELADDPAIAAVLDAVQGSRLSAHLRAVEDQP